VTSLADYTSLELILSPLHSRTATAAIGELCATLSRTGRVKDQLAFYQAVLSHEALGTSAISPGWALPHARLRGLEQLSFALGHSPAPLNWPGAGAEPVHLVFLFAVPEAEGGAYLTLISGLAKLSQEPERVERLLRAPDAGTLFRLLQEVPLRQPQKRVPSARAGAAMV
jgi:mannitol/fructose-specific phosphotransferase system IIA component (Ntr-type)